MDFRFFIFLALTLLSIVAFPSVLSSPLNRSAYATKTPKNEELIRSVASTYHKEASGGIYRNIDGKLVLGRRQARFLGSFCDLNSYLNSPNLPSTASVTFIPLCAFLFAPFSQLQSTTVLTR